MENLDKKSPNISTTYILDISDRLYDLLFRWLEINQMKGNDVGKEKNIQSKARQVEEIRELANKYGLKLIEKKSKRKKELIGLIQDDLPQTIQILIDSIDPGNSNHNILVYAMYSYNGIQEGLKKETIKPEDARQEEAKIFHTILDMIKSLEEDLI